jgi:hypothetical protein
VSLTRFPIFECRGMQPSSAELEEASLEETSSHRDRESCSSCLLSSPAAPLTHHSTKRSSQLICFLILAFLRLLFSSPYPNRNVATPDSPTFPAPSTLTFTPKPTPSSPPCSPPNSPTSKPLSKSPRKPSSPPRGTRGGIRKQRWRGSSWSWGRCGRDARGRRERGGRGRLLGSGRRRRGRREGRGRRSGI